MTEGPINGVLEYPEVSQIEAGTKILIYILVLGAKISVLSPQRKLKTWGHKCPPVPGGLMSRWLINSKF